MHFPLYGSHKQSRSEMSDHRRRSSVSSAVLSSIFRGSTQDAAQSTPMPIPPSEGHQRSFSIPSTGLFNNSPPAEGSGGFFRRGSLSGSELVDENAIEEDDLPPSPINRAPSNGGPNGHRRGLRSSAGEQLNWADQLKFRAENSVSGRRASMSSAISSGIMAGQNPAFSFPGQRRESMSNMPGGSGNSFPGPAPERRKPDAFQERILKGDFYMD
jgi:hypothetical protein